MYYEDAYIWSICILCKVLKTNFNVTPAAFSTGLLGMAKIMEQKTVHLAPLPSDWGDIHVTATITTENKKSTLGWDVIYPSSMPQAERAIMEETIAHFMKNQHEDLIRLFGD